MEAFLVSTGIVALAEIGDKTQLLAFVSPPGSAAAAYRCGDFRRHHCQPRVCRRHRRLDHQPDGTGLLRWVLGASFLAMAVDAGAGQAGRR
jgi:hypothetical protein